MIDARIRFFAAACLLVLCACGDEEPSATASSTSGPGAASSGTGGSGGEPDGGGQGGAGNTGGFDPALAAELQAALDAALDQADAPGAVAAVRLADGSTWVGASGRADTAADVAMAPETLFHVGSITKSFVSAATLRLAEQGDLSLEDPIVTWVPGYPGGDAITVRHLLAHTSGIYNYTSSPDFAAALQSDPRHVWTPDELIALASAEPPLFLPGEGWSYSNTNFILLGEILEATAGVPAKDLLASEVIEPLALTATSLSNTNADVPEALANGYDGFTDVTFVYDVSAAWTAGGVASSAGDLTHFLSSLLHGEVVDATSLDEMTTPSQVSIDEGSPYGLGLMRGETPLGTAWGHSGGIWGFLSLMLHVPSEDVTVVGLINSSSGDEVAIPAAIFDVLAQHQ